MQEFTPGQKVRIPCFIAPGAFPCERLVEIESEGDRLTGFVIEEHVREGRVMGRILAVGAHQIIVKIPGSFFTTASGTISVSPKWAVTHLEPGTG